MSSKWSTDGLHLPVMAVSPRVLSAAQSASPRRDFIPIILLVVICAAATIFLSFQVLAHRAYPFDNDEAAHAVPALLMLRELQTGDLAGFAREVYGQDFYPPGAAVFLIPAYLVAGPSPVVARLASVAALILAMLVLFALARAIDPARGAVAGLIAVTLTLTARPLLTNAGLAMLEAPGLLVCLLLLWAYVRAARRPSVARFVAVGVLLAAAFLTKYTYGLVTLAAVGLSELVEASVRHERSGLPRRWLLMFGPFLLLLAAWFFRPGQLTAFVDYTQPLDGGQSWLAATHALYYLRSFAIHSAPSALFALVNLAAVLWALFAWRDVGIRVILLYFLFGMGAVMLVNHPPNPRFIATFVPAAQLLTGLMIVRRWPRSAPDAPGQARAEATIRRAAPAIVVLGLAALPVVYARYAHYASLLEARLETSPELAAMADWIAAAAPTDGPVYLINPWDQFGPQQIAWSMARQTSAPPPDVIARVLEPASPATTATLAAEVTGAGASALVLIEGGPWGAPFWPDYTTALEGRLQELDRRAFRLESYAVSAWLDDNSLVDADWAAVKAGSRQQMDVGVIIYELLP